uniref:Retrotransposon Orf1 n=1 Tax=Tanacetum cinerariifolium TaxID=118510 RepID=A0A6L2P1C1_TANCI|nr:retrotransposon Orf1 [Tanacetum cinerariifolium]
MLGSGEGVLGSGILSWKLRKMLGSGEGVLGSGILSWKWQKKGGNRGFWFGRETLCLAQCFEELLSVTKTGASDSTILSKPFIKFVKSADCTEVKTNKVKAIRKSSVKYVEMYRRTTKKPNVRGNQRNWNNLKSHQLGPNFIMKKKACFNCGDFNHLAYDCRKRVKKGTFRSQNKTHESFNPRLVVHRPFRPPRLLSATITLIFKAEDPISVSLEPAKKRDAKETLLQESFKKLRAEVEVSGSSSTQQEETPTGDPTEISEEDVQNMLQIILMAEFKVEALQVKVGGITQAFQSFEDMLKDFDREDLDALFEVDDVQDFKKMHLGNANPSSSTCNSEFLDPKKKIEIESWLVDSRIVDSSVDSNKIEYFDTFPTLEELEYHEWLLKCPKPSWVKAKIRTRNLNNIKISCMIGHFLKRQAYINLESPIIVMSKQHYKGIMNKGLESRQKPSNPSKNSNFVGRVKGLKVFVGNFTYECNFMILEDTTSIIDHHLGEVVFGKPSVRKTVLVYDLEEGRVTFKKDNEKITFKIPHKMEAFNHRCKYRFHTTLCPRE